MELTAYPEYKNSGQPSLGKIPAHWDLFRNGRLFSQRNETGFGELPILEVSLKTGVRVRDMENLKRKQVMSDREKYKRAAQGDIAYNMMRMWQGAVGIAPVDGLVSPAYVVMRPFPEVDCRYFTYLFRTGSYKNEVDAYSRGIVKDRNRLYWQDFKRIPSVVPPIEEQRHIASFLDTVGGKVQRFIRNKRRLIELLKEQKQNVINQAVTRGLNPNVKLKPSGVEWIGDIPEHWEVIRFKHRVGFQEGPGIMAADFRESGVPLLRISCLASPEATLNGCNYLDPTVVERRWNHFRIQPGDYLLSASASTGGISRATEAVFGAIPYTGIIRLWPLSPAISMDYLRYFISSRPFIDQIDTMKSGVGIEHFGPTHLKRMWVSLPPHDEQLAILKFLKQESATINQAITRTEREIELMREYRIRLISDVVTGQVDVRGIEVPEVAEEELPALGEEVAETAEVID